jgi:hypothetical protein
MRAVRGLILASALLLLIAGCGGPAINAGPFLEFEEAVVASAAAVDSAASTIVSRDREMYLESASESLTEDLGQAEFDQYLLKFPGRPYSWQLEPMPIYLTSRRFASTIRSANAAWVEYANTLRQLVQAGAFTATELDSLAGEINASIGQIRQIEDQERSDGTGLFSATAVTLFKGFVEKRKKERLKAALGSNQGAIDSMARRMERACEILAYGTRHHYEKASEGLLLELGDAASGGGESRARETLAELTDLNEASIARLERLKEVASLYALLPAAHRDLLVGLDEPEGVLPAIRRLASMAREVKVRSEALGQNEPSRASVVGSGEEQ